LYFLKNSAEKVIAPGRLSKYQNSLHNNSRRFPSSAFNNSLAWEEEYRAQAFQQSAEHAERYELNKLKMDEKR